MQVVECLFHTVFGGFPFGITGEISTIQELPFSISNITQVISDPQRSLFMENVSEMDRLIGAFFDF